MSRRIQEKFVIGLLLVMTPTTQGKWWFSFENPAKNHRARATAFAPAMGLPARRKHSVVVQ